VSPIMTYPVTSFAWVGESNLAAVQHDNGGGLLRRNSPSLPTMRETRQRSLKPSHPSREMDFAGIPYSNERMRPVTPQMDISPLHIVGKLNAAASPILKIDGPEIADMDSMSSDAKTDYIAKVQISQMGPPPTPKRRSSTGATLRRSYTVDGRNWYNNRAIAQFDGGDDEEPTPRQKNSSGGHGMTWLYKPAERSSTKAKRSSGQSGGTTAKPASSLSRNSQDSSGGNTPMPTNVLEARKRMRDRALTDPVRPRANTAISHDDINIGITNRHTSYGGYSNKLKSRVGSHTLGVTDRQLNATESTEKEPYATKEKTKGWKKRVFSKGFFVSESKAQRAERKRSEGSIKSQKLAAPASSSESMKSVATKGSDKTAKTIRSLELRNSSDTNASQAASTTNGWQIDGMGAISYEDGSTESRTKAFNDSVIGIIDGKVGSIGVKDKFAEQWRPPILGLNMQAIAEVDRIPVKVNGEYEIWVAVIMQGRVPGGVSSVAINGYPTKVGLDVGVLLDISYAVLF
jgi:hypothetical protein